MCTMARRNCALTATGPQLGTVFTNLCQYLADALLEARTASHSRAASASNGGVSVGEARERFHAMCQVLAADFMPYASRCLHGVMRAKDGSLCSYVRARTRVCVCPTLTQRHTVRGMSCPWRQAAAQAQLERATLFQPGRTPEPLAAGGDTIEGVENAVAVAPAAPNGDTGVSLPANGH